MNDREEQLWAMIEARDTTIRVLRQNPDKLLDELQAKEDVIQQQNLEFKELREVCTLCVALSGVVRPVTRRIKPLYQVLRPRLGRLKQHPPRPLWVPPDYRESLVPRDDWPRISLVTPSYNQADFIERTMQSVLSQSYPDLEYFVQDGASDDDTPGIIARHANRLDGWASERDGGQADAINRGFARTNGEVMAWLNSDDLLLPGALQYVGDYFARHPEVDVVYGHRVMIDEEDREIGRWVMPPHDDNVLSWADFVPQETLFWRRGIWEKAGGGLDAELQFALDWDLLLRFRDAGARFVRLPRLLGAFRVHEAQKTSAVIDDVGRKEMDALRQHQLGYVPSDLQVEKAVFSYLLRHRASDLWWAAYEFIKRR